MDKDKPMRGACGSCAFLARHLPAVIKRDEKYQEIRWTSRTNGELLPMAGERPSGAPEILCLRGVAALQREVVRAEQGSATHHAVLTVLDTDRKCRSWALYRPGLDPIRELENVVIDDRIRAQRREMRLLWFGNFVMWAVGLFVAYQISLIRAASQAGPAAASPSPAIAPPATPDTENPAIQGKSLERPVQKDNGPRF